MFKMFNAVCKKILYKTYAKVASLKICSPMLTLTITLITVKCKDYYLKCKVVPEWWAKAWINTKL